MRYDLLSNLKFAARVTETVLCIIFRLVKSVTESFSDRESFQDAVEFFEANEGKFVGSENAVKQALEHVRLNVTWRDKDIDSIKRFLESSESKEL